MIFDTVLATVSIWMVSERSRTAEVPPFQSKKAYRSCLKLDCGMPMGIHHRLTGYVLMGHEWVILMELLNASFFSLCELALPMERLRGGVGR